MSQANVNQSVQSGSVNAPPGKPVPGWVYALGAFAVLTLAVVVVARS